MDEPPILEAKVLKGHLALCVLGILVLCGLSGAAQLPFARDQNGNTQLLGMLGAGGYLLALMFSLLFAWTERRELRLRAVIPLLLFFGSCAATTAVERATRQAQFEKRLPRYQALVARIQAGDMLVSDKVASIPLIETERDLGYGVLAQRDTNGVLTVELLAGGGFPLKHSGYLYSSSGSISPGSFFDARWPLQTQVTAKWFRICD